MHHAPWQHTCTIRMVTLHLIHVHACPPHCYMMHIPHIYGTLMLQYTCMEVTWYTRVACILFQAGIYIMHQNDMIVWYHMICHLLTHFAL